MICVTSEHPRHHPVKEGLPTLRSVFYALVRKWFPMDKWPSCEAAHYLHLGRRLNLKLCLRLDGAAFN